ncbi:MAG: nitroreductase family protein [Candidatus Bathyarchaeota archaeon]|nr:MAG: nitroreductase family protein [Candidatus Bathyarchaeota archaeon]
MKNRRSVRAFTREDVTREEVEKLIDAARWAPSAGNLQPWEFIVVRKPEIKRGLSIAALNQTFIEEAPVVIVVCANQTRSSRGYGVRGINLYCLQDTAAATQNMLLAASALELATCWVGAFKEEEAKRALNLPEQVRPVAIIPIGHSAKNPMTRSRRPLSEIIHFESYRGQI